MFLYSKIFWENNAKITTAKEFLKNLKTFENQSNISRVLNRHLQIPAFSKEETQFNSSWSSTPVGAGGLFQRTSQIMELVLFLYSFLHNKTTSEPCL